MTESEAFQILGQMPHCDFRVLHAPSSCSYCDEHPEWQAFRILYKINFTGENDISKAPCPSTVNRPLAVVHRWRGNRPTNEATLEPEKDDSYWKRLQEDRESDESD